MASCAAIASQIAPQHSLVEDVGGKVGRTKLKIDLPEATAKLLEKLKDKVLPKLKADAQTVLNNMESVSKLCMDSPYNVQSDVVLTRYIETHSARLNMMNMWLADSV